MRSAAEVFRDQIKYFQGRLAEGVPSEEAELYLAGIAKAQVGLRHLDRREREGEATE